MKFSFLIAAFVAVLGLSGCGGGSTGTTNNVPVASPAQLSTIDTVVGTGAEAVDGKTATVKYTGWLYSDTATDHKGTQFQTGTYDLTLGVSNVIAGFYQGVKGMKVGGKRTILIPASLAWGSTGTDMIPPNSGVVFDVEVTAVQ